MYCFRQQHMLRDIVPVVALHVMICRYPTTCLFSSHLIPRPADWGAHISISGFLSLDDAVSRCSTDHSSNSSSCSKEHSASKQTTLSSSSGYGTHPLPAATAVAPARGSGWQPTQELSEFLAAGPPPLYIGFGSMVVQDPQQLMQTVVAAVQQLPVDQRVIICSGWSGMGLDGGEEGANDAVVSSNSSYSDGRLLFIQEAPHDWLFPR